MKYETITKTKRNQAIIEYSKNHPELSLDEIGKMFMLTRQRVHQILKRGIAKKAGRPRCIK